MPHELTPAAASSAVSPGLQAALSDGSSIRGLSPAVRRGLIGIVCARLAVNGGIRVVYPFLPVIARGLGVSLEAVALLVAARSMAGLAGPVIARVAAAHRHRTLMLGSQVLVLVGCLLIAASAAWSGTMRTLAVGAGFVATGLARPLFDLPVQTWVSAHVAAAERGRALGLTELGWALSLATTVPLAGVLIDRTGWRGPFGLVAAMAIVGGITLVLTVSRDAAGATSTAAAAGVTRPLPGSTGRIPTAAAVCAGVALAVAAGEALMIVYGEWLTDDFGLSATQIGVSTMVIVTAELIGEGLVIAVSDRLGLRRTLLGALAVSALTYAGLQLVGSRVELALVAISTLFVAFEVTVVVFLAFASTVVPDAGGRARLLGAFMAAVACGNAIGAAVGPLLFALGGIAMSGGVSAGAVLAAAAVLWSGRRTRPGRLGRARRDVRGR